MTRVVNGSVQHWDRLARTRWGRYLSGAEAAAIDRAQDLTPFPRRALDVGCGGGRWTRLLVDRGWAVTSLDVDPEAVRTTAESNPGADCRLVGADDRRLPVDDGSVSLIVCIEVLPVSHADWFPEEAGRALVPGGRLVTVLWNRSSLRGQLADAASHVRHGAPHDWYQTPYRRLRTAIEAAGFDLEAEQGLCWGPFGRGSDSRLVPFFVRAERLLGLQSLPSLSPWVLATAVRT